MVEGLVLDPFYIVEDSTPPSTSVSARPRSTLFVYPFSCFCFAYVSVFTLLTSRFAYACNPVLTWLENYDIHARACDPDVDILKGTRIVSVKFLYSCEWKTFSWISKVRKTHFCPSINFFLSEITYDRRKTIFLCTRLIRVLTFREECGVLLFYGNSVVHW